MALCPRITTYPPLGKVSVLEPGQTEVSTSSCHATTSPRKKRTEIVQVQVTAIIEWERDREYPFEFEFLYSDAAAKSHPSSWTRLPLPAASGSPCVVQKAGDECHRSSFTTKVSLSELAIPHNKDGSAHVSFTVQHRQNVFDVWKLSRVPSGVESGEFIIPAKTQNSVTFEDVMKLEDGWTLNKLSLVEDVETWQLTATDPLKKSQEDDIKLTTKSLGVVKDQSRFMAITRIEPFWFGCEHDQEDFYLDNDAVLLSFLNTRGQCVTLFAFNGDDDFYTVFRGRSNGVVNVCGRNDGNSAVPLRVLAAVSQDKQKSIAAVMAQARQMASKAPKLEALINTVLKQEKASPEPAFFDNFGFCTWNALGQDLTREKLLSGLEKLAASGVKFNTLLIDDNWQTLGKTALDFSNPGFRGWSRFEANEEGFPGGLAGLISEIKAKYPHIQYVGVWHALFGYWAGLSHDSEFPKTYKTRMTRAKVRFLTPTDVLIIDPSDIHRFYDDFYTFLRRSGVDFVKTDVQHMLGNLINPEDRSNVPSAYQSAWTSAYVKHFNGRAISCMSQIPQISFHSFLQEQTPKILLRNSDDFFPEIPGSHPFHLFVNAHNSLITQHLNCVPDWDMFQTSHAYSSYHGAARAISGGPVLITDEPGSHDVSLMNAMTALSPRNTRIAIRPEGLATTVDVWDSFAAGQLLKIGAVAGRESGARILGLFNVAEGPREALIPVADFFVGDKKAPERCVLRSYATGQVFLPPSAARVGDSALERLVKVNIATRGWDVVSAYPAFEVEGGGMLAVLGLVDKISGAAAVSSFKGLDGKILSLRLKALGTLAVYSSTGTAPTGVVVDGEHNIEAEAFESSEVASGGGMVFSVDLEKWWAARGLWNESETLDVRITF